MTRPPLRPREAYAHWHHVSLRWNDNDIYGHVNNAIYYFWFDSAVNDYLIGGGLLDIARGETITYAVETGCRYASPLHFPGSAEIGLALDRIGQSSIAWQLGVFARGAGEAAAEGRFVQVCVDRASGRPTPVPHHWRRHLEAQMARPR